MRSHAATLLAEPASLLHGRGSYGVDQPALPLGRLALIILCGASLYGLAMGSLEGRWLGGLYSAIKVPLLVMGTTLLCLPSFFVLNAVLGLGADFRAALRGVVSAQGTVALCLASLAPVLGVFYVSRIAYPTAMLTNGGLFAVAVLAGQATLRRHYAPLIARNPRHRLALFTWMWLYVFVSIKFGWILRPFIGDPDLPLVFLRADQWMESPYANLFWTAAAFVVTAFS